MALLQNRVSRRATVGLLGGLAMTPFVSALPSVGTTRASAQPLPSRMDLGVFVQDPRRVASLRRGVEVMRSRLPSNPTSWFFQAAVHGVTQQAVSEAAAIDPAVASVDQERFWNQCPHYGQSSAEFLLWHRAYLHYFEGILRDAAGDPTLAIPYWNYRDPGQRTFPRIFAPETLGENGPANSLYHSARDLGFVFGVFQLTEPAVSIAQAFNEQRFFGPTEEEGFAGGIADTDGGTQGLIERSVHNLVHFAVGGAVDGTVGAMGSVPTAALDPVFWVHHAMIDKLWVDWMCSPTREWGSLPDDAWFDDEPWAFYDETGSVKTPSRRSVMDHKALGYAYDTDDPACAPLALPEPSPIAVATNEPTTSEPTVLATFETQVEIGTEPLVVALEDIDLEPSLAAGVENGDVLIEVVGIRIIVPPLQGYDVYLLDDADVPAERDSPGFLGTLALFGLDHEAPGHLAAHEGSTQRFRAGAAAASLDDLKSAVVVVRPFDLLVLTESAAAGTVEPEIIAKRMQNPGAIAVSAIRVLRN